MTESMTTSSWVLPLSVQRMEELQPADEDRALAHAVEASLSRGRSPNSAEKAKSEMAQALEASVVESLLALPSQTWSATLAERAKRGCAIEEGNEECSTCIEPCLPEDDVIVLRCAHYFHKRCINDWFLVGQQGKARSCPTCAASPLG